MGDWSNTETSTDDIDSSGVDTETVTESEQESSFMGEGAPFDPRGNPSDPFDNEPIGEPNYKLGFLGALAAAIIGGAIWAAVYTFTGYEIGWLAIGLGAATGGVALRLANYGSPELGMGAGAIAVVGLVFAKFLIGTFGVPHMAAQEALDDSELMTELVYMIELEEGAVPPEVQSWYESPDEEFPSADVATKVQNFEQQLGEKMSNMADSERQAVANRGAAMIVPNIPFADRYGLSGYDLLWFGIAVFAAFRLGRGDA